MSTLQLKAVDDRVAVVTPSSRSRFVVVDWLEDLGLVQIKCPLTEDGKAPTACPELCPIKKCMARDRRDRNRYRWRH